MSNQEDGHANDIIDLLLLRNAEEGSETFDSTPPDMAQMSDFLKWNTKRSSAEQVFGTSSLLVVLSGQSLNIGQFMQLDKRLTELCTWKGLCPGHLALLCIDTSSLQLENGGIDGTKCQSAFRKLTDILRDYPQVSAVMHVGLTTTPQKEPQGPEVDYLRQLSQDIIANHIYLSPALRNVIPVSVCDSFQVQGSQLLQMRTPPSLMAWTDSLGQQWSSWNQGLLEALDNLQFSLSPMAHVRYKPTPGHYNLQINNDGYYYYLVDGIRLKLLAKHSELTQKANYPWPRESMPKLLVSNLDLERGEGLKALDGQAKVPLNAKGSVDSSTLLNEWHKLLGQYFPELALVLLEPQISK